MADQKILVRPTHQGAVLRLVLNAPRGNVLDAAMTEALEAVLDGPARAPEVKALVLEGAGAHFSFGASVEEHLPGRVGAMLRGFHGIFRRLAALSLPTVAVVRGRCLGGGMELATFSTAVFASESAAFGQPEVKLGVFAPIASIVLPWKIGQGASERLLVSGATIDARAALAMGLVQSVSADPEKEAVAFIEKDLLPSSAAALRFATRAARRAIVRDLDAEIAAVESLYLDELMATKDAVEGIRAFLDKRPPVWSNR